MTDIKEISEVLKTDIRFLGGLTWTSKDQFMFNNGNKYFIYNITKKKGKLIYALDEKAENITFNSDNNLILTVANLASSAKLSNS